MEEKQNYTLTFTNINNDVLIFYFMIKRDKYLINIFHIYIKFVVAEGDFLSYQLSRRTTCYR